MTDSMDVVCVGPPDAPHPRQMIRRYTRLTASEWVLMPPLGVDIDMMDDRPVHGDKIQFRCRDCKFNAERRLDRYYGEDYPPLSMVFEKWWAAGQSEITARGLVSQLW